MGDKLKKEQDELKVQLKKLVKEHEALRSKMADKLDRSSAPSHDDVQAINISCDELLAWKRETQAALDNFSEKLDTLTKRVCEMTIAIDEATAYSYQYNIKIVGVPEKASKESAADTADICLKMFNKLGVSVKEEDIDIAHRVPTRNKDRQKQPNNPHIVCKFVRRVVRNRVLDARYNLECLEAYDLGLPEELLLNRIGIFPHLPPKLQTLLRQAKKFQADSDFKYCWAKSAAIFLRKTDQSRVHKLVSTEDLEKLRLAETCSAQSISSTTRS